MKKFSILTIIAAALLVASCSKAPDLEKSIPDEAFVVASMHPQQIYEKGQIATFEGITSKIKNEILLKLIKEPAVSGIDLGEYMYMYSYFLDEDPVIGITFVLKDAEKFAGIVNELIEYGGEDQQIVLIEGYSIYAPEGEEAGMAWNDNQLVFLMTPDKEKSTEEWQSMLTPMFDLSSEEAVTSIVDFNDFSGKMKDMNVWFTGDEIQKLLEKSGAMENMEIQLPVELYNNYVQLFMDFDDGAMYVHSETHFSDDVSKAASSFMVAKDELNKDLLDLAPGNDLLMAMAFSVELDKMVDMMKNFSPPEMDSVSGQIEKVTGVPGKEMLEAMNGDFVIAVNGAPEGAAIPVELLIGIGLDDESLQEKLMDQAGNWADVKKEGDFFSINANGMEIYSGIINDVWVITNVSGYKTAVSESGLEKTLLDSKFDEFAGGSMGMYMNLDLTTYPAALQAIMSQGGAPKMLEMVTESFSYLGMEASNNVSDMTLKTAKEDENSLYTLLKILEQGAASKQ